MPAYLVHIKNEYMDETAEVWDLDKERAISQAGDLLGAYSLADTADATAVAIEPYIPLHEAWRVGDWIASPWAVIHADYARVASDYELTETPPDAGIVIQFLETAQAVPAEPVEIRLDHGGRYSVVMRRADNERAMAVEFWLPAWEMGLDWGAPRPGEAFPVPSTSDAVHLLTANGRVVGVVMGLRFDRLCHTWKTLWRDPGEEERP